MSTTGPPRVLAWLMRRFTKDDPTQLWLALRRGPDRGGETFFRGAYVLGALVTTAYLALSLVLLDSIPRARADSIYHPAVLIFFLLVGVTASLGIMMGVAGPSRPRRLSLVAAWLLVLLASACVLRFD